jgi:lipopolysaccharide biosynthesis glycosyltransferase
MQHQDWSIWIGFDPRETAAFAVCRESIKRKLTLPIPIYGVILDDVRTKGLYRRPTEKRLGRLYDTISEAPMSTEFAISRFLVPHLAKRGLALFMDCDMLARANLADVFRNPVVKDHAVSCVKHVHEPKSETKMDDQIQTRYARKNWSSFMVFNCDHPANNSLTVDLVNNAPGRDLHRFCWLADRDIGELDPAWNCLLGHTKLEEEPKVVHFTDGGPWFTGFEDVLYADEWRMHLERWAA